MPAVTPRREAPPGPDDLELLGLLDVPSGLAGSTPGEHVPREGLTVDVERQPVQADPRGSAAQGGQARPQIGQLDTGGFN